ncbi:MAG: lamin tail domain-containing protein, partial [Candidatus Cloacimonetes bacterium]|nr:lamin tail domain-containing protein [Candidatus Cloacimonadota bacterium]
LEIVSQNNDYWDGCFIQTADIDASDTFNWNDGLGFSPIGNVAYAFFGNYDGNQHTISNLYINNPQSSFIGLFGKMSHANISDLGLVNVDITGEDYVGSIIGSINSHSTVQGCFSTGFVTGNDNVGGMVGVSWAGIGNCYSFVNVIGNNMVGGLIGAYYSETLSRCYSTGQVTGNELGGLIGSQFSASVVSSFWDVETSNTDTSNGGIGLTTIEMKDLDTYLSYYWSINSQNSTWGINEVVNNGYPYLSWQEVSNLPSTGEVLISEISDNLPTESVYSGFIELYNNSPFSVDISGYQIRRGDNSESFIPSGYYYTIPDGTILRTRARLIIGNGATEEQFKSAWSITEDKDYLAGDSALDIANGYAYQLWNPNVRAQNIDESPDVNANEHIIQETPGVWSAPDSPENSTPGENSSGQILPVTLSSFTAVQTDNNCALLEWITQSESNTAGYNVLRNTVDNVGSSILANASLIAGTNTSTEQHYSFTDEEVELNTEYYYWLENVDFNGTVTLFGPIAIKIESDGPEDENPEVVYTTGINSLYPNPFNPSTTIAFTLKEDSDVKISIFNLKGGKVRELVDCHFTGRQKHTVVWDGKSDTGKLAPSGMYFLKFKANDYSKTIKAMMIK